MKQFLVPALLLALVGTAVAIASNSAPVAATPAHGADVHALTAPSGECQFGGAAHGVAATGAGECSKGGAECAEKSAECSEAAAQHCEMAEETKKSCEEKMDLDCCKKKLECGDCKKDEAPAQKP